jgi:fused signal recognition particle receptor
MAQAAEQPTVPAVPGQPATPPTGTSTGAPPPTPAPEAGMGVGGWVVVALIVAFFVLVGLRLARRKRGEREAMELPPPPVRPEIPPAPPPEAKEAIDREAEAARAEARIAEEARRAEEQARRKAEYDRRKREEAEERARREAELSTLSAEERAAREAERARLEAEARAAREAEEEERRRLRAEEEERKKAEYKARKEAERAERERKRAEAAEAEAARLRAIEEERQRALEEERRKEEERKRRAAAEGGKTLLEGLSKTREGGFVARLAGLFGGKAEISEESIAELEEILFTADIGVRTSMNLVDHARERLKNRELGNPDKLRAAIRADVEEILVRAQEADPREPLEGLGLPLGDRRPWVIMVVGVNGAGKTTTIGKLAAKLKARGQSVILAAGDTFRAAATEQLDVWAERAEVPIVKGPEGGDPGAVVFDAVKRAVAEGIDVVIADTAGRLHTKAPLMEELKRVKRVIGKAREGGPDETLLVLDATNGQNAIQQARQFHDALGVTGIVLTKLDGTAKGGVVIGIADELKIPVRMIGIGESLADLRPFEAREFVKALFG